VLVSQKDKIDGGHVSHINSRSSEGLLGRSRSTHLLLGVVPVVAAVILWQAAWATTSNAARSSFAKAIAARQIAVKLTGHFHLVGRPAHVLTEQGSFTGTVSGPATIHFTLITLTSGTATVVFYPAGGSISGRAVTRSKLEGANVYFGGYLKITGSAGKWNHTTGTTLSFSGYLNRDTFQGTAHLSGSLRV
jgi:hypothetical protein